PSMRFPIRREGAEDIPEGWGTHTMLTSSLVVEQARQLAAAGNHAEVIEYLGTRAGRELELSPSLALLYGTAQARLGRHDEGQRWLDRALDQARKRDEQAVGRHGVPPQPGDHLSRAGSARPRPGGGGPGRGAGRSGRRSHALGDGAPGAGGDPRRSRRGGTGASGARPGAGDPDAPAEPRRGSRGSAHRRDDAGSGGSAGGRRAGAAGGDWARGSPPPAAVAGRGDAGSVSGAAPERPQGGRPGGGPGGEGHLRAARRGEGNPQARRPGVGRRFRGRDARVAGAVASSA